MTCPYCGAEVVYDTRAGRMPKACKKDACKRKARKSGGSAYRNYPKKNGGVE